MFIAARMKRIEMLTLASDEPKVTEAIGDMGVLHLTKAPVEGGAAPLVDYDIRETEDKLESLIRRADSLRDALGISLDRSLESIPHASIDEIEGVVVELEKLTGSALAEKQTLVTARVQIEKLLRDTAILQGIDAPVEQLENMSFLHFAFGSLNEPDAIAADNQLREHAVILPYKTPYGESKVIAISSKKGRWAMETELEKRGFRRESLPPDVKGIPLQAAKLAESRLGQIVTRSQQITASIHQLAELHGEKLVQMRQRLDIELKLMRARSQFSRTWATMLITGWLPEQKVECLKKKVHELTGGKVVFQINEPSPGEDSEPPTLMHNNRFLRPFEMLLSTYSLPRYNEIEPTPIMALLFPILFGLMFGDIGHSAVLLAAGLWMLKTYTGKTRDAGIIITFCGISGIIFGFVYGSFFGLEKIAGRDFGLFHPLEDVQRLLLIAVIFGAGVISIGVILNIVNRFKRHEFFEAWFDRFGVIGGLFYWGAIAIATLGYIRHEIPWYIILILIVAPLTAIGLYKPIQAIAAKARGGAAHEGIVVSLFEGILESFETVLSYTANTLSFARVGAFALAHAALSLAVYELINVVKHLPGGVIWSVIVFLSGTAVIIFLEGLIVVIQSLRLEYYEFLAKFYRGEGRKYEPFSLKTK